MLTFLVKKKKTGSFPGCIFLENTRKSFKSCLVLEAKGLSFDWIQSP